jgi:dTDP-4-dehydrorhamnose reductase
MAEPGILVTGAAGQLGRELKHLAIRFSQPLIAVDVDELDITQPAAVTAFLASRPFAAVINAAAYTAVDKAESDAVTAFRINRDGCAVLAQACRQEGIPLFHVSTDYVFDGTLGRAYTESDLPCPNSVYGHSKFDGEKAIRENGDRHFIIRTSWLYSPHGTNFVKTILKLAREREELRVIDDQKGSPTSARDLAEAVLRMFQSLRAMVVPPWGIYHYCGKGVVSWCEFAREIVAQASHYEKLAVKRVLAIPTSDYPLPASRPAFSALDCSRIRRTFNVPIRPWKESLAETIKELYT